MNRVLDMPAISVRPPWSWTIAEAAALQVLGVRPKLCDNRSRPIPVKYLGRDVAIHSTLAWCPRGGADPRFLQAWAVFAQAIGCFREEPHPALAAIGDRRGGCVGHGDPRDVLGLWIDQGVVSAVARLADCHRAGPCTDGDCHPWGDALYAGRPAWHLVFEPGSVRRLDEPVPVRGQQMVPWTLPPGVAAAVVRQVGQCSPATATSPEGVAG